MGRNKNWVFKVQQGHQRKKASAAPQVLLDNELFRGDNRSARYFVNFELIQMVWSGMEGSYGGGLIRTELS